MIFIRLLLLKQKRKEVFLKKEKTQSKYFGTFRNLRNRHMVQVKSLTIFNDIIISLFCHQMEEASAAGTQNKMVLVFVSDQLCGVDFIILNG